MFEFTEENEEVLYAKAPIAALDADDLAFVKARAAATARRRCRVCTHENIASGLHEMLIVHAGGAYVRPHMHLDKAESHHVIEGNAEAIVFEDTGAVTERIDLGPYGSGKTFYYRMPPGRFHTLMITSEWFVFHETTTGPFERDKTRFASWAPEDDDLDAVRRFIESIS
jgi:cupin fold WbuC family metalloprotein